MWLDPTVTFVVGQDTSGDDFLEGIDIREEGFEDWLRERRAEQCAVTPSANSTRNCSMLPPPATMQPSVVVLPVIAGASRDKFAGDTVADVVIGTILQQGCVEVLDLRGGLDTQIDAGVQSPVFALVLRIFRSNREHCVSVVLKRMNDGRVVWTGWYNDILDRSLEATLDHLPQVASEIANAVHDRVHRYVLPSEVEGMFVAVHNVLSHSRHGQVNARAILADRAKTSGVARAWLMYTFAVAHAERHGGLGPEALEELEEHCIFANDAEPDNPVVQAITGHINAFVFRRSERADEHHKIARKIGWNQPIVWTLSAMHANYNDRPEYGYEYSKRAMVQSTFSPYRFVFEGPHSISCSLTGRHSEAIDLSKRILAKKPVFLAVMRHMVASQILSGDVPSARNTIEQIRAHDPRFVSGEIASDDYPLPSAQSVQMIEHALTVAEMKRSTNLV